MLRNKTPFELFAFEAPFMSTFRVSASVTVAASPNFVVGRTKSLCFWLCTRLCPTVCMCVYCVCAHVYSCQPAPVIGLRDPPAHMGYLVCLNSEQNPPLPLLQ